MKLSKSAVASSRTGRAFRRFLRNHLAVVGAGIVVGVTLAAVFAPQLAPMDPLEQNLKARRALPSVLHLLGTDQFGRDILSRILYGARYALLLSSLSVGFALVFGTALGVTAGYVGGVADEFIMRTMDLFLAFPYLLLAILIVSALGPGIWNTILAIGIWGVPIFSRQARGAMLNLMDSQYIEAARALGASNVRIVRKHLLRNIMAPLLVYAAVYMGYAILMESALTFLGLGIQPPTPSWAEMIASGRNYMLVAPHIATIPGIAIMLITLGFNLLGDGLRDALDPRRDI